MKRENYLPGSIVAIAMSFSSTPVFAQTESPINIGVILDGRYQDGIRAASEFEEGFGLGHTEVSISGNIDERFRGVLTTVIETAHDGTEIELEEAFVEGIGIGRGTNFRAGRMLSSFGYLNGRHLHEDDFSDRPAVYRTYLGGHYYDDGIAANFVLPTENFFSMTFEAFDGEKLAASGTPDSEFGTINAWGGQFKFGGDAGQSSSWQLGLSLLENNNGLTTEYAFDEAHDDEHEEDHEEDHEEESHDEHAHEDEDDQEHDHGHGPEVTGERLTGLDFTWKWAPDGNFKNRNLTLSMEYLKLQDLLDNELSEVAGAPDHLNGWYMSAAYQFSPRWTLGFRYGEVETLHGDIHHDDHGVEGEFEVESIDETDISLAWHPSHFSTVRASYTRQRERGHETSEEENIFVLQYVMSFGAHAAHSF